MMCSPEPAEERLLPVSIILIKSNKQSKTWADATDQQLRQYPNAAALKKERQPMEKTLALRLYGKNDVRLEEFELPEIKDNEILADVYSDSICMSTYKVLQQGEDHKRVPPGLAENPIIVGHEICGHILKLGKNFEGKYKIGQKYSVQPAMNYPGKEWHAPGYSFPYFGGNATKVIIPHEIMDMDCLLTYDGEGYFMGSLVEVMSCIVGGFQCPVSL
jgi:L-sorbose 1-phosphate reductase